MVSDALAVRQADKVDRRVGWPGVTSTFALAVACVM
jgi:hypothetical protein